MQHMMNTIPSKTGAPCVVGSADRSTSNARVVPQGSSGKRPAHAQESEPQAMHKTEGTGAVLSVIVRLRSGTALEVQASGYPNTLVSHVMPSLFRKTKRCPK